MMTVFSGLLPNYSGLKLHASHPGLIFQTQRCNGIRFGRCNPVQLFSKRIPRMRTRHLPLKHWGGDRAVHVGSDHHQLSYDDDLSEEEPFWLTLVKEAIWALRSLFVFLAEQPNQLKYIEWPSFQSTLKTAVLTLILVAIFIVALSSVDYALSYMLAILLKRAP
ncbi:uncharacterized protein LOC110818973 [Carica papaya]|uniref:uncharacterized protein LOC110818973 n=1 Tax=Carica papaya TaxID=3649 RepID=UPI000B8C80F9|nr:uncharacterized protein LOC110818973 [Carica papaya]